MGVAESWTIAPDFTRVTFKIRKGVPFHHGWGDVTAEDVVWGFNDALKEGTINNGAEQLSPGLREGWELVDQDHAAMNIRPGGFNPMWLVLHSNVNEDGTFGIVSKKAYDQLGEEKFIVTEIGSGPFTTKHWRAEDEVLAEAVPYHWRVTPGVQTMRIVQMKELAVVEAALTVGEVDVANVPAKAATRVAEATGATALQLGLPRGNTIEFSGNYWGKTCDPACPQKPWPRPGFKPDADHPWIGDPSDPDHMERARKVRWALAMAIDREKIVDKIMGGFAKVMYAYGNVLPDDPTHKDEWIVPYDPAKAKELLTEAGYPDGFKMNLALGTGTVSPSYDPEATEAIGEMWRQHLNLDVTIDRTNFAVMRPTLVDESIDYPFTLGIPFDWALGGSTVFVNAAGPGLMTGWTYPDDIAKIGRRNDSELDLQKRIQNNIEVQDRVTYWMPNATYMQMGAWWMYTPVVAQWTPHGSANPKLNSPETIVLK